MGVTSKAITIPPLCHSGSSLRDKEFSEAKKSRNHQAECGGKEVPHPAARGMDVREHPNSQRADSYLRRGVYRQDHVPNPIDHGHEGDPVDVGIVPWPLGSKGLKGPSQSGNHETRQSPVNAVRKFVSF